MRDDGHDRPSGPDPAGIDPDLPWLHGTWRVVLIDGDRTEGVPEPPWLTFDGDGVVFGHAGVNRVRGTWRLDGVTLGFGPVVATLMAGPDGPTGTERALLAVLGSGGTVARRRDGFTLRTPTGRVAELERVPAAGGETSTDGGGRA